jgi:hypothetical protein
MKGRIQGRRANWLGVAFAITAAIAVPALGGPARAAAAGNPPAAKDVVLAGFTAQHFPVFFKVLPNGHMVLVDGIALSLSCASGGTTVWQDSTGRAPIHANGKIRMSYAGPTILTNGTASTLNDALTARLNPKHTQVTGTWQLAVHFTFSDGTSDQCDSGPVSFSATT